MKLTKNQNHLKYYYYEKIFININHCSNPIVIY